jgi:hypothetical protein
LDDGIGVLRVGVAFRVVDRDVDAENPAAADEVRKQL